MTLRKAKSCLASDADVETNYYHETVLGFGQHHTDSFFFISS